jgi:2,5-diamino-6-(ribosylamino)-4(3H)-pyrimidinone 5'-phosphate reductase
MRPYTILNAAMTLDGKIATGTGSSEISGKKDIERVHRLRKELDGIMVGINTVLVDNPKLTAHKLSGIDKDFDDIKDINPVRIVVDSYGRTPIDFNVLNDSADTIIAVSNQAVNDKTSHGTEDNNENSKINQINGKAEVFVGGEDKVDLKALMEYLYEKGIKTLLLEGGATLNFSMLKENLVDEIRICVAPMIVGGKDATTLVGGEGFDFMDQAIKLEFKDSYFLDEDLILEYLVKK